MNETQWLDARREGLGASESAAALGICPFTSRLELWHRKTDPAYQDEHDQATRERMYWGTKIEPLVRQRVAELYGCRIDYAPYDLRRHPEDPWRLATPDGIVYLNQQIVDALAQLDEQRSADK